jgi:hypothetical protein
MGAKKAGLTPGKDVKIDTSVAFAAMSGSFIGGNGDFVSLFEPNALQIEQQGYGYVVASLGELGGVVPYTSYSARKSYIKENSQTIEKFERAILKEGEREMYSIAQDLQNDTFIQRFQTLHFVESIRDGLYFDGFVPRGCMAVKQKAQLKDEDTTVDFFCFGRIESDFEDFFNQVKE